MLRFVKAQNRPGVIEVGWLIDPEREASFIWEAPRRLTRADAKPRHAKSVTACPAVNDYESRLIEVTCPIDLHLRFGKDKNGDPAIVHIDGEMSSIRPQALGKLLLPVHPSEWRHPARPLIQVMTPYLFVADAPVYLTMLPAFAHYSARPLPGLVQGGRFPIHVWPRELVWAFEWHDTTKDIHIDRGDPWFYVSFETQDPSRAPRLIEAEMTPALRAYTNGLHGVTNYVSRTYSLFHTAAARRPASLLKAKKY